MSSHVIMFHSVGCPKCDWVENHLSVSLNHFEEFCKYLEKNGTRTIYLEEWYKLQGDSSQKEDVLALTFDDGYLDNWVYVYPLLKKYGLKGTIFTNPEFIDPGQSVRKNLLDTDFKDTFEEEEKLGFLNWAEIVALQNSGVMDIQSHSMSHNFYFCSDKLVDIYREQKEYYWMAWYQYPERKPYYLTEDQTDLIPDGEPIFESGRALGLRRYFPDPRLREYSIKLMKNVEKPAFELIDLVRQKMDEFPGRFETDEEREQRYRYELFESKKILEEKLGKPVDYLCWPGGGYNELSLHLAKEAGYKASTLASSEPYEQIDNTGSYKRISRFGMGSFIYKNKKKILSDSRNRLVNNFKARRGSIPAKVRLKIENLIV